MFVPALEPDSEAYGCRPTVGRLAAASRSRVLVSLEGGERGEADAGNLARRLSRWSCLSLDPRLKMGLLILLYITTPESKLVKLL